MVELKSIEQLLYFMKSNINLSRYDLRFIDNLQGLQQVTTNQVKLFHKIVLKHSKQFLKHDLYVNNLVNLPWNITVIESSKQFTDAYISVIGDNIIFKCPYNKNFIAEFRNLEINKFNWVKEKKEYHSIYGQHELKILINTAIKHFQVVNFCPTTKKLMDDMEKYSDVKYWEPTLVRVNGNLFIAAINEFVYDAIKDIKLDVDHVTMSRINNCGVHIDRSLHKGTNKDIFFTNYFSTAEYSDIETIVSYIKELGCKTVVFHGLTIVNSSKQQLLNCLKRNNIEYINLSEQVISKTTEPMVIFKLRAFQVNYYHKNVIKIIQFLDSTPIQIK